MPKTKFNFEQSIKKFQSIIDSLESNELTLDDQLSMYEDGMKLAGEIKQYLNNAELKIIDITKKYTENNEI